MLSSFSLQALKRTTNLFHRAFSAITVAQIKELRGITGSSIEECKKALEAEQGDIAKAKEFLRKRGLAIANKKESRTADEGVIGVSFTKDQNTAIVAEVACETDFVAKTELFQNYVKILLANLSQQEKVPEFNFTKYESGVEEEINKILKAPVSGKISMEGHEVGDLFEAKQLTISKLQENIKVKKLYTFRRSNLNVPGVIGHYVHLTLDEDIGKSCCLIDVECGAQDRAALKEVANNLAMQILGTRPEYLKRADIPAEVLNEEIERAKTSLKDAIKNKPQNVVDRMVEGKLKKFLEDSVLSYQEYMAENQSGKTVEEYLKQQQQAFGSGIKLNKFKVIAAATDD